MIYDIKMDSMGSIIGTPRNKRERKRIARYMREMKGYPEESFYLQKGFEAEGFIENNCSEKEQRNLEEGYTLPMRVDPWTFAHYFGYDCHTLYE